MVGKKKEGKQSIRLTELPAICFAGLVAVLFRLLLI